MTTAGVIWLLILVLTLAFEGYTIWVDRTPNTTLSYFVIRLRAIGIVRGLLVASIAWLLYHWFYESDYLARVWTDDWAVVMAGFFGTLVKRSPREGMR